MKVILIRHAVTAANARRYIGRSDVALSITGHAQAQQLSEALIDTPIDVLLSSPLTRALDTARRIERTHGLEIEHRAELQELHFGEREGMPKPEQRLNVRRAHLSEPIEGGESLLDLHRRLAPVHTDIEHRVLAGQTVAVVGHYWSNRVLLARLLRPEFSNFSEALATIEYKPAHASAFGISFITDGACLSATRTAWLFAKAREQ